MKRLTLWYDGYCGRCEYLKKTCATYPDDCALSEPCEGIQDIVDRLAAYEDTGLEPEEAEACKVALMGKALAEIKEIEGLSIERMKELAKAEAEDRLLVLPCRIGEDIYTVVTTDRRYGSRPCKHPIRHVRFGQLSWNNLRTVVVEFGKSVFLTREEAAEALRKEQKKEDE